MNNQVLERLDGLIELILESSSRVNEAKATRYWHPLSMATYGSEEILEALDSMCSFRTTMWEKTATFEAQFAAWTGSSGAVMVNSGSSADLLLSFALADPQHPMLTRGSTVLVSAVTWPTQIWSLMMAGFNVELVDVDPLTLNIDVDDLKRRLTPAVSAVSLVHLMGNPCRMGDILPLCKAHGVAIVEDCCEALGSRWRGHHVGSFGIGAAYSFFFAHHMTTMEGGMVTVSDPAMVDKLRVLRAHGWLRNVSSMPSEIASLDVDPRYAFVNWGFNLRPTELQAGFGLRQLEKLPGFNARRAELSKQFYDWVDAAPWLARPKVEADATPSWMALPIMVDAKAPFTRKQLVDHLESHGVETRPVVTGNVARQPVARAFASLTKHPLPGADAVHERGFYVGLSPIMTTASIDRLIGSFDTFTRTFD
jgi:CDP-6-deoxy-D-xylo-4-hexulose-3-dehydrase